MQSRRTSDFIEKPGTDEGCDCGTVGAPRLFCDESKTASGLSGHYPVPQRKWRESSIPWTYVVGVRFEIFMDHTQNSLT
jgi:hypothetical protein